MAETDKAQAEAVETTQVGNILRKLQAGKVITHTEMAQVEAWREKEGAQKNAKVVPKSRRLTVREETFCQLIAKGMSGADAYTKAYLKGPECTRKNASEQASKISTREGIRLRLDELRDQSLAPVLLSLDERLTILARDARSVGKGPQWMNARARVLEIYSKLAGDLRPDSPPMPGESSEKPLHVSATAVVHQLGAREKARLLREGRSVLRALAPPASTPTPT